MYKWGVQMDVGGHVFLRCEQDYSFLMFLPEVLVVQAGFYLIAKLPCELTFSF